MMTLTYVSGPDVALFGQTLGSGTGTSLGTTTITVPTNRLIGAYNRTNRAVVPPDQDVIDFQGMKVLVGQGAATLSSNGVGIGGSNALSISAFLDAFNDVGTGVQRVTIDVPLATITAQTSGTAFNIGPVLPVNARLIDSELVVLTPLTGGSTTACHATVQGGSDAAGSIVASTDVFTAAGNFAPIGSNPYAGRSAQQLKMTITGDGTHALSALTAGHLQVNAYVTIVP